MLLLSGAVLTGFILLLICSMKPKAIRYGWFVLLKGKAGKFTVLVFVVERC